MEQAIYLDMIKIEKYKIEINELEKKYESIEPLDVRIEKAKMSIRKLLDINYNGVDEKIIEEFIEKIVVHKDYFEWKLNFLNDALKLKISGKNKSDCFLVEHEINQKNKSLFINFKVF